ncbi:phosphoribosylformylglycinamidine cyclo-ligase [Natranaerobius trueperi]|uniref:Phosphoribosylformylglycinamidine cyclo-ligase n=1 Tax=Natranaerobius trueperi TaxID=759412 RepID=A0A226C2X6_9FIRM|nr:phosphoribosylformylglycinamidine cyclo-ligase [Natranaerobius trueperi]OWZ84740.1 phosphoribosylformylglycinamidine cyclo-ligase [Natranaerobius trueperi]
MGDNYKSAGVDIEKGNKIAQNIQNIATDTIENTDNAEILSGVGGFGALFQLKANYQDPVFVTSTDGVGTKLKLAKKAGIFDTIGIDLVAMCVNDILVQGAKPLVFLDYLAMDSLNEQTIQKVLSGITKGCSQARCSLVGGETAEMPGFYQNDLFDLAGFTVGVVEKKDMVDGSDIKSGDLILGISSSGIHSNGYSLVRKTLLKEEGGKFCLDDTPDELENSLEEELLKPTKIYVDLVHSILEQSNVTGMAHITGGGLYDNISRVLSNNCAVRVSRQKVRSLTKPIFDLIQKSGKITEKEMFQTFNMGVGFVLILPREEAHEAKKMLDDKGEQAEIIGEVIEKRQELQGVIMDD